MLLHIILRSQKSFFPSYTCSSEVFTQPLVKEFGQTGRKARGGGGEDLGEKEEEEEEKAEAKPSNQIQI